MTLPDSMAEREGGREDPLGGAGPSVKKGTEVAPYMQAQGSVRAGFGEPAGTTEMSAFFPALAR